MMHTIKTDRRDDGTVVLESSNLQATIHLCSGRWEIFCTTSGGSLRAFTGKSYKSQATAIKRATAWLVGALERRG